MLLSNHPSEKFELIEFLGALNKEGSSSPRYVASLLILPVAYIYRLLHVMFFVGAVNDRSRFS